MLPLDGVPVLEQELRRVSFVNGIDEVVVATTTNSQDDILDRYISELGYSIFRGTESDVLARLDDAAEARDADIVLWLSGDNPIVPPRLMERVLRMIIENDHEYYSNKLDRTLPIGVTAEAFDRDTFNCVARDASDPFYREHVSRNFTDFPGNFDCQNVTADEICSPAFLDSHPVDSITNLRLTLDWAEDNSLFRRVYENIEYDGVVPFEDSVDYIFSTGLDRINADVSQKVL
jgi:spore coat polysaccharide biosynthesis protein SpsF